MPRTLPWLTGLGNTKREASSPAAEIKRSSSPRVKYETPTMKDSLTSKRDFLKSSPSPPSSPIHRCPSEEYLREGLDKDDIFMMVEDEFYAVAQTFTRHLHYAEFVARKKEVKLKNAETIADIARPTDGVTPMSEELKKKYAAEELQDRQKEGVNAMLGKQVADDEDLGDDLETENSWAGTHLQDLMLSPRKARALVGAKVIRSTTRAAAGFSQSSGARGAWGEGHDRVELEKEAPASPLQGETTDDEDDLDVGVHRETTIIIPKGNETWNPGLLSHSSTAARGSVGLPRAAPTSTRPAGTEKPRIGDIRDPPATSTMISTSPGAMRPADSEKRRVGDNGPPPASSRFPGASLCSTRPISINRSTEDRAKKLKASESGRTMSNTTTQRKRRLLFDDDFDELSELQKPSIQPQRRRSDITNVQQKRLKEKETGSKKSRLNEVPMFLV
ncbi:hypothetical protein BJY04DRAFT_220755 [Aspergillus karnatakaensis]|uniref:uncharacterized protein n=1 Tax=Aspergillus karnatakaensis TaxID=1810916 RepID=UPI003CCDA6FD